MSSQGVPLKTSNKIVHKLAELESLTSLTKCDILAVTETWLNANVNDSEILNNNYNLFRRDCNNGKRGGGVLLAVNSQMNAREVNNCPVGNSEILLMEINPSRGSKILFVTC